MWRRSFAWTAVQRLADRGVARARERSGMMVLTLNDHARYDPYALPVLAGAAVAVLSLVGVPRLRTLPPALVLFLFSMLAGALVVRGSACAGRSSLPVIPVTCALSVSAIASLMPRVRRWHVSLARRWL
jgi:hypothetical protein